MPKQILLVEDELILCENYAKTIREHGYEVITCHSKQGALEIINRRLPDLAILDIGLGDEMEAGFDLCREIRSLSGVLPIIFLTARDSDIDTVSGLRLGADDYLGKPFEPKELLLRIKNILNKIQKPPAPNEIYIGSALINLKKLNININNKTIKINPQEKKILGKMLEEPGKIFSRDNIGKIINISKERTIDVMITRLRQKIESNPKNPKYLQTIRGSGYVLWIE